MEQLVSLVRVWLFEIIGVQLLYLGIIMRLSYRLSLVLRIECGSTLFLESIENVDILIREEAGLDVRLSAARNASAGASHYLDEGVF